MALWAWKSALAAAFVAASAAMAVAEDVAKLIEQLGATDREHRRDAAHRLSSIGAEARPALPALLKALEDADRQVWAFAVTALGNIGPEAKDAIPILMRDLDSRTSRGFRPRDKAQTLYRSAFALAQIGEAAKPGLVAALTADDETLRIGAAKALGFMGAKGADGIPGLIENLGHGDGDVRGEAADALAAIGKPSVGPLVQALQSLNPKIRAASARSLGILGMDAAEAAGPLLAKLDGEADSIARAEVLRALPKTGAPAEKIMPAWIAAVKANDAELNRAALDALLLLRPPTAAVAPLRALLDDPALAPRAAQMLGRLGRHAREAVPALLARAAKSPESGGPFFDAIVTIGRPAAPALLEEIGKLPPAALTDEHWTMRILTALGSAALPDLQAALAGKNLSARVAALRALRKIGPDARSSKEAVAKLANDPQPMLRAAALPALIAVGGKGAEALELIETALADKAPEARLAAAEAAEALATEARPIAGKVAALLNDANADVQIGAIEALAQIGGGGEWTRPLVAKLDQPKTQLAAIRAVAKLQVPGVAGKLATIYPGADRAARLAILDALAGAGEAALPVLQAAAKDPEPSLRAAALRATAKNKPELDSFVQTLAGALTAPESEIRRAAAESVSELAPKQPEKFEHLVEPLAKLAADEEDRTLALDALRSVRPRNLDVITPAIDSPVLEVRIWAIERLARMGAQARPARAKLEPLLADQNEYLRRASRRALEQIGR